jgi:pimeloyl-ACP methyl ester carboxylesterase
MQIRNKFQPLPEKNYTGPTIYRACIILSLFFILQSCNFADLKKDLQDMNRHAVIRGEITFQTEEEDNAPCIIAAFDSENRLIKYKLIQPDTNYYVMQLPDAGIYKLSVFQDINRDSAYQLSEPAAFWVNPQSVKLEKNNPLVINFSLSPKTILPESLQIDPADSKLFTRTSFKIITGEKTDLNHFQFSREYGSLGLWKPFEAFRKYGVGVYFTEDYNSEKIPVLFVYGMGGYAGDWETVFNSIDRSKFQPWFYFYPSGYSINASAKALSIIMDNLKKKYKFNKLFIIAHSMGGLVAHKFISLSRPRNKKHFIRLFISISTPWGGDKDAEWGQKAPATIPCWNDIVPSSEFIKNTKASDLDGIPYYMLFTFKGDRKPFRINNDTTISIASQLKMEFQLKAEKVYGFNDHHAAILHDISAIDIINSILKKSSE